MPYNIYNINWNTIIKWQIPTVLRDDKMVVWVKALIRPIVTLYQDFMRYRDAKAYQLKITPQVCYLEMMLNDAFDLTLRRIRIDDALWHIPISLFQEGELKPVMFFQEAEDQPVILYTDGEAGEFRDDFVVLVPMSLVFNEEQMKGKLDIFKLGGTKYKIQRI